MYDFDEFEDEEFYSIQGNEEIKYSAPNNIDTQIMEKLGEILNTYGALETLNMLNNFKTK